MDNDTLRWLASTAIAITIGSGGLVALVTLRGQIAKIKADTNLSNQQTRIGAVTLDQATLDLLKSQIDTVESIARHAKEESADSQAQLADAQKRIRALEAEAAIRDAEHAIKIADLEKRLDAVTTESSRVTSELEARYEALQDWGDEVEGSIRQVPEPTPTEIFARVKHVKPERLNGSMRGGQQ